MWSSAVINMLVKNTGLTLYMTLVSTVFAYILGLPMGIALVVTAKEGLRPNKDQSNCRKSLWTYGNYCAAGAGSSAFYCKNGGVLSA